MARKERQLSPAGQKIATSVLCLIFITVGLSLWIPGFLLPVLEWSKHRKWKPVPCTILKAPFTETGLGVKIRYEVDGTVHEPTLSGGGGFFDSSSSLLQFKEGSESTCYVNPYSPREAVLTRDFDPELFIWCAPLLFVFLPLLALGAALFQRGRPEADEAAAPKGSVVLTPQSRRGCGIAVLVFLLLMFGLPIAILVMLPGFRENVAMRLVYLVPLGLVVLMLLKVLLRTILRAFNPTLTLTVTPGEGIPGRPVEVRWEARGSFAGIKRFHLLLEGREEAHGKSLRTEPFATIDVFQGGTKDFKRGLVKVPIPANAMPTLVHGTRRIAWVLRLTAEVSVFPDLFEEYPYPIVHRKGGGA